jgi:hypothetical protein
LSSALRAQLSCFSALGLFLLAATPAAAQEGEVQLLYTGGSVTLLPPRAPSGVMLEDLTGVRPSVSPALSSGQVWRSSAVPDLVRIVAEAPGVALGGRPLLPGEEWALPLPATDGDAQTRYILPPEGAALVILPLSGEPTAQALLMLRGDGTSAELLESSGSDPASSRFVVVSAPAPRALLSDLELPRAGAVVSLGAPEGRGPWVYTPRSLDPGDTWRGLITNAVLPVQASLVVRALYPDTRVELLDLTDGDDTQTVLLQPGELFITLTSPLIELRAAGAQLAPSALDRDLIELRASRPVQVHAGAFEPGEHTGGTYPSAPVAPNLHAALLSAPRGALHIVTAAPEALHLEALAGVELVEASIDLAPASFIGAGPAWAHVPVESAQTLWLATSSAPFVIFAAPEAGIPGGPWLPARLDARPTRPPVAVAGSWLQACPGQQVILSGLDSYDADPTQGPEDRGILSWSWDLDLSRDSDSSGAPDDDADAAGPEAAVTWSTAGRRQVRLTVTDDDGQTDTDDVTIDVRAPSAPLCGGDPDGDGIGSLHDVCPEIYDVEQRDRDGDGEGDACDRDRDNDGVLDDDDRCPLDPDPAQADGDGDGLGDACDPDRDGDGVDNARDNCPLDFNRQQRDTDGDGLGDACDPDDDADGVPDDDDSCPLDANSPQIDTDGDGLGDICDPDDDDDGAPDDGDNCPATPNADQADTDRDGVGDACALDRDRDGVPDASDRCPDAPNPDQRDTDGDGEGDACDDDRDGDLLPNGEDNCPLLYNPRQEDEDGNGQGDACEGDADGDGVPDHRDACPSTPDPAQRDLDRDGLGDACDDDRDGDGLDAAQERAWNTRQDNPDTDGDGLNDGDEVSLGTHPARWDTDGDGLSDGQELRFNLAPLRLDTDGDGLRDGAEPGWDEDSDLDGLINALDLDSDNGGLDDGAELTSGRDMLDPTDDMLPPPPVVRGSTSCATSAGGGLTPGAAGNTLLIVLIWCGGLLARATTRRPHDRSTHPRG